MHDQRHLSVVPEGEGPAGAFGVSEMPAAAFESWYRAHHSRLRSMCDRMLKDSAQAEDVAQETLLRAWTRRDRFEADADMGPWLRTVARNLCIEAIRARSRAVPASDSFPDFEDTNADPTFRLERAEEHAAVREAMLTLSERHRDMLYARDVHGIDYAELATREGLSENATRAVLFRARRVLRDKVAAATRAVGAAAAWVRLRARDAADKGAGALGQPAFAAIVHGAVAASLAIAFASGGVALPRGGASATPTGSAHPAPGARSIATGAESADPSVSLSGRPAGPHSPMRIAASVNRKKGEVSTRTTVRNPVTGQDEYVWTRVWREHGSGDEDPSIVLGLADRTANAACEVAPEQCEQADQTLEGGPTP